MTILRFQTLILTILFSLSGFSQNQELDSLLQADKNLEGIKKVNNLINISRLYFILDDSLSISFSKKAIELSKQIDFPEGIGKANLFLALFYDNKDKDLAVKYYLVSSETLDSLDHPWSGYGYENASRIYRERGWYPESLDFLFRALKIFEDAKDTVQIAKEFTNIGFVYDRMGNYREAIAWQKKALQCCYIGDTANMGLIYGRIGISYDEMGMYDSAHFYNEKAVAIFKLINDRNYLAQWLSNIGNTFLKQKKYKEAESYLFDALDQAMEFGDKTMIFINLGHIYTKTNRYKEAEVALDSAIFSANLHQQLEFLDEAYFRKYELRKAQGNIQGALDYYILYSETKDSLITALKTEQVAQMTVRYETEQKEKELAIQTAKRAELEKENAVAEIKIYNRNKWIIGISALGSIILFFALFIIQRNRRLAQAEKDAAIITERDKGIQAVIDAQEDERKRIAKDLHDGIGQQLSGLKLAWTKLASDIKTSSTEENKKLIALTKILNESADEVRAISHQMMPKVLSELGLAPAIDDMLSKSIGQSKIKYEFETFKADQRFQENIEISIFRVAQELINNIIKHSEAVFVNLQLFTNSGNLILIIEDNGKGFDLGKNNEGHGLLNIKSRINAVKGDVSYNPSPGSGTVAIIKVPIIM